MTDVYEFYNLGIGDPVPISAASRLGLGDLLDEVAKYFPEDVDEEAEDDRPKIAIVGKPNVGKSSLINKLVGEDRVIVSDIAGKTRDTLEEVVNINGILDRCESDRSLHLYICITFDNDNLVAWIV